MDLKGALNHFHNITTNESSVKVCYFQLFYYTLHVSLKIACQSLPLSNVSRFHCSLVVISKHKYIP